VLADDFDTTLEVTRSVKSNVRSEEHEQAVQRMWMHEDNRHQGEFECQQCGKQNHAYNAVSVQRAAKSRRDFATGKNVAEVHL